MATGRPPIAVAALWQGSTMPAQPPALRLDWDQVLGWRLRRHHLDERAPGADALGVVADIAGLHAQIMSSAELTLWTRVEGLDRQAVHHALWRDRTLVKTWAMRGTLHLLPAAEFPLWQAALSTRRGYQRASWQRGFGVTLEQLQTMLGAITRALDGQVLSREALAAEVGAITGSPELGDKLRHSWGSLLKPAASQGLLCFGPGDGQLVRFTRPDQWLPGWRGGQDPDASLLETARRFLRACGVVTREDYARWWGVLAPEGGRVLKRLGDEVVPVEVGGAAGWMLAAHATEIAEASAAASVRLLPAFDQYVVAATRHAEQLMPGPFKDRVYRPQGWLSPVLLAGGSMLGTWRQEAKGRRLEVTIEPFTRIPAAVRRQAEDEAERLATWAGATLDLAWADQPG
jgi:uncharacterized protein YcaQ